MSRIVMAIGLVIVFIGWILYRLIIKKDLKKKFKQRIPWTIFYNTMGGVLFFYC